MIQIPGRRRKQPSERRGAARGARPAAGRGATTVISARTGGVGGDGRAAQSSFGLPRTYRDDGRGKR